MPRAIRKISATYRIVTPMFCGGASPESSAELRLSSLKGALRFWWRSLMGSSVRGVDELHKREAGLFGSADSKYGRSKVNLRIVPEKTKLEPEVGKGQQLGNGQLKGAYYLGYGVLNAFASRKTGAKAGELTRPMIPGGNFTVEFQFLPSVSDEDFEQAKKAIVMLGMIGGLGSKSRKGFGSLTLVELMENDNQLEVPNLQSYFSGVLKSASNSECDWTSWSRISRVVTLNSSQVSDPLELLNDIGQEQVYFRSWGKDGRVLGMEREGNFERDHDMKDHADKYKSAPDRIAFGLPHNYREGEVKPQNFERRASPLFIHLHQANEEESPQAVLGFLPSRWLPGGEKVKAFNKMKTYPADGSFWYPIHAFLDRLVNVDGKPPARPGYDQFPSSSSWWEGKMGLDAKEVKHV